MADNLSPNQVKAVRLLAMGMAKKEVAQEVGVTPQTVSGWCKKAEFVVEINKGKGEILKEAQDEMRGLAVSAVKNLGDLIANAKNERVRLQAVRLALETVDLSSGSNTGLWDCGPTSLEMYEKQQKMEANPELASLLGPLYF